MSGGVAQYQGGVRINLNLIQISGVAQCYALMLALIRSSKLEFDHVATILLEAGWHCCFSFAFNLSDNLSSDTFQILVMTNPVTLEDNHHSTLKATAPEDSDK